VLKISGQSRNTIEAGLRNKIVSADVYRSFLDIDKKDSIFNCVGNIAVYDAQHAPLYYILLNVWCRLFGGSIWTIRFLSVIFGILMLPLMYMLAMELFSDRTVAYVSLILLSLCPFHVLYAQEAKMYSLWAFTVLFSNIFLLRAARINSVKTWACYSISLILGMYSHIFFVFVIMSHVLYIVLFEKGKRDMLRQRFGKALMGAGAAFLPWIYAMFVSYNPVHAAAWTSETLPLRALLKGWMINLTRVFIDINADYRFDSPGLIYYAIPVLILLIYAVRTSSKSMDRKPLIFITAQLTIIAEFLILSDLIFGGRRSVVTRYFTPSILMLQLMLSYVLADRLRNTGIIKRIFLSCVIVCVIAGSVYSCGKNSGHTIWWNKYMARELPKNIPATAELIKAEYRPLVIIADNDNMILPEIISLANILGPEADMLLLPESKGLPELSGRGNVFILGPSIEYLRKLKKNCHYRLVYVDHPDISANRGLWKVLEKTRA